MDVYADLRNSLSQTMLGVPYDADGTQPEKFRIDHLVELARAYGMGDVELAQVQNAYRDTGFDFGQWASSVY